MGTIFSNVFIYFLMFFITRIFIDGCIVKETHMREYVFLQPNELAILRSNSIKLP